MFGMLATALKSSMWSLQRYNEAALQTTIYEPIFPLIMRRFLTSFFGQRLYLRFKHKGWNPHVGPHLRRQATLFVETSHSQLKRLCFTPAPPATHSWEALTEATNKLRVRWAATWLTWPFEGKKKKKKKETNGNGIYILRD